MGFIEWYMGKIRMLKAFPDGKFVKYFLAKIIGSLALGLLIAAYVRGIDWTMVGWIMLLISLVLGIPPGLDLIKGKKTSSASAKKKPAARKKKKK